MGAVGWPGRGPLGIGFGLKVSSDWAGVRATGARLGGRIGTGGGGLVGTAERTAAALGCPSMVLCTGFVGAALASPRELPFGSNESAIAAHPIRLPSRGKSSPCGTCAWGRSTPDSAAMDHGSIRIVAGDNLPLLEAIAAESYRLIYVDPPFNTGKVQERSVLRTVQDEETGDRTGFAGKRYRTEVLGKKAYGDSFDDYLAFLEPRLEQAHRLLTGDGSLFVHLDFREVHYVKVMLDRIFGRDCFINELIWAYDYGARSKRKWSAKHDTILWYAKHPKKYYFDFDSMDRIPYMAPGLVGPEKAARGKTPTDVWWHTIVSPNGKEKTGYPTQKPIGVLQRIVNVHSEPGDQLLDFFAGSGSFGEAGALLGRNVTLIDQNPAALGVMRERLAQFINAEDDLQLPLKLK